VLMEKRPASLPDVRRLDRLVFLSAGKTGIVAARAQVQPAFQRSVCAVHRATQTLRATGLFWYGRSIGPKPNRNAPLTHTVRAVCPRRRGAGTSGGDEEFVACPDQGDCGTNTFVVRQTKHVELPAHTGRRSSRSVGRSAAGRELDPRRGGPCGDGSHPTRAHQLRRVAKWRGTESTGMPAHGAGAN